MRKYRNLCFSLKTGWHIGQLCLGFCRDYQPSAGTPSLPLGLPAFRWDYQPSAGTISLPLGLPAFRWDYQPSAGTTSLPLELPAFR